MENASQDKPENITDNPKSWIAWKRVAESAEAKITVLEARAILSTMQKWRDSDHDEYLALTRSEVITLIEGVRILDTDSARAYARGYNNSVADRAGKNRAALRRVVDQCCRAERLERRFRRALESIASNTCCSGCQEAALVASSALLTPALDRKKDSD